MALYYYESVHYLEMNSNKDLFDSEKDKFD